MGLGCCGDASGGAGICIGTNVVCSGDLCVPCGAPGGACCSGSRCTSPGCCSGNLCVAEGAACGASGGACQAGQCQGCGHAGQACCSNLCYDGVRCNGGTCSSCGHIGEACCPAGGSAARCQKGGVCSSSGSDGVCARCGSLGDKCCPGSACAQGCCTNDICTAASGACTTIPTNCGNGVFDWPEACDDGNTTSGDGCAGDCSIIERGWQCRVPGKPCIPECGDGLVIANRETCDDGNTASGDGCSSICQREPGADCSTPGKACVRPVCGNGKVEPGESCDCGLDASSMPSSCRAWNGLFYGDGRGCSKTCTREPVCQDASGKTQACTSACGDNNIDPGEECDDGNGFDGDGCSSTCKVESHFTCTPTPAYDYTPCQSGTGQCLALPIIYRDFQPENVAPGGHPDFPWLGTRYAGSPSPTTVCVPSSGGPSKGGDSTARCWGIAADSLVRGKPQKGPTSTCACQYSEWNTSNSARIPGGYSLLGNDSPLSDGAGSYLGTVGSPIRTTSTAGAYAGSITAFTFGGGPVFRGVVPACRDEASFNQWFNDDTTVNRTFVSVLEMQSIGTNLYQYRTTTHLAGGGFFPLDTLNPAQATLCNLWPYWNHGNGTPIWPVCVGDQYWFPPRVLQSDCPLANPLSNGCWVANVRGALHNSYFTDEARYYFVYNGATGISLQFFGDDDLFVFINGVLVLDLGGIHQQLPGKVIVNDSLSGNAQVTEGGCLDAAGNIQGAVVGSTACWSGSGVPITAGSPEDFRVRTVPLGLVTGKVYEIAIFGADRHPPESNFQLTLSGFTTKRSVCTSRCGDGVVSPGEECDLGDLNNDTAYGGCTKSCRFGSYCGDASKNGPEECDLGKRNGDASLGANGCTVACTKPRHCGDGIVDGAMGEECDLGASNGLPGSACSSMCKLSRL